MVELLTITSGASLVGVWVYKQWERKKKTLGVQQGWWQASWQRVQNTLWPDEATLPAPSAPAAPTAATLPFSSPPTEPQRANAYGLRTATAALGVTTVGQLCYPPLQLAGLPLLIYMGIPSAQEAYTQLAVEGRLSRALAETVVLVVCLAGGYYWVGALGFWLYYEGRTLMTDKQRIDPTLPKSQATARMVCLRHADEEHIVAVTTLKPGDHVIVGSGESVPVDGVIREGVAWLHSQALSSTASSLRKGVGDRVTIADIVLVGRICVRVTAAGEPLLSSFPPEK